MVKLFESKDGAEVYELENGYIRLRVTNYGAAIFSVEIKNENGEYELITLTCDSVEDFMKNKVFLGATVGRTANRVKGACFTLNGKQYDLEKNEGNNNLHGGFSGYGYKLWDSEVTGGDSVAFHLKSPDGEGGYPGNLEVTVKYSLKDNVIRTEHKAKSDADTIASFTNHVYWCISGHGEKIYDQQLFVNAEQYIEVDEELIPTGQILNVKGTPYDFTSPCRLGDKIDALKKSGASDRGYDESFVRKDREPGTAAVLTDEKKGISLEIISSYPDVHVYTGDNLNNEKGARGLIYTAHDAICLECGMFPDAVNHPCFGKIILREGEAYDEFIEFKLNR